MKRIIKFRAWLKSKNRMLTNLYGFVIDPNKERFRYYRLDNSQPNGMGTNVYDLSDIDLMQFTGLTDKNGAYVYEGDICRFFEDEYEQCFFHGLAFIDNKTVGGEWEIIRCDNVDKEMPQRKGIECLDSTAFWNIDFEIIGNIHQNKDLLK